MTKVVYEVSVDGAPRTLSCGERERKNAEPR